MIKIILLVAALVTATNAGSVTDSLLQTLSSQGKADAVLELPSVLGNVLSNPLLSMLSGATKLDLMTNLMKQLTTTAQAPFMNVLNQLGVKSTQPFWITNKISMKSVDLPVVNALKALPGLFTLREPFKVKLIEPTSGSNASIRANAAVQWGVQKIGADKIWSTTNGEGVIVANIDTGVQGDHEALKDNYAGQWHDAINQRNDEPYDDGGHGTHTMGTICGTTNGIGVAPGARWVACKGLGEQGGTDVTLTECAQWVLNLEEKPVVVSNSWGGGQAQNWYNDEIKAWQAAGIIPVFAIGNDGPNCGSANSPGDQPNLISVGATTNKDAMARFSSRGKAKRSGLLKPEVSAPGQDVLSAWPDGSYQSLSGTSMACPHVAGAVALMKAAKPDLTFNDILQKLEGTADKPTVASADKKCGGSGKGDYPNNAFGYGRINVMKAMK